MLHNLELLLPENGFFEGLERDYLRLVAGCAKDVEYHPGEFLFREGESADVFYLIRQGHVALEIAVPGRESVIVQTLGTGDVAGFSWLIDAHVWQFDGRAVEWVHAVKVDGTCLRGKCEDDPRLGFELMRRFAHLASQRLQATRLQLLDVYAHVGAG